MPPALLDNSSGASKTHVRTIASVCIIACIRSKLSLIQAIGRIGKDHAKPGQVGTFDLSINYTSTIVRPAHHIADGARV
jgi:hypothetical protein